ncbi:ABC transporter ATP-binding protein [soil metagenome]
MPVSSDLAVDLQHVEKTYRGRIHALRGVAMQVRRGEIFGLLGPNGAGKSTLVKILTTVISPTRCTGTLLGQRVGHKPTLARVGYLPEHHRFPEYLTGRQVLTYFAALSGVERRERRRRAAALLSDVGMARWADTRVRQYSKGMRQRIGVAQALMMDPALVILDEPTDGVDPVGRRDIRDILQRERAKGKAVFVNSHLLSELEQLCDRCAIMVQGRVWAQGTVDELTEYGRRHEVAVDLGPAPDDAAHARLAGIVRGGPDASSPNPATAAPAVEIKDHTITIKTSDPRSIQPLIDRLRAAAYTITAVRDTRPSLEELFMRAVTDPATGRAFDPGAAEGKASPAPTLADMQAANSGAGSAPARPAGTGARS